MWIPTHLAHDCESDDTLAWLLAQRANRLLKRKTPVRVLVQLATDDRLDVVAKLMSAKGATVVRDPDSRNAEAVLRNFGHLCSKQ